jgi:LmbE family N-acetylglucosaminyl deacetylase
MQIGAHQDDDLLFMSPDVANAITAGYSIVSVYLTAGQASGAPGMCAAEFAAARQVGIKAAYAQMVFPSNPQAATLAWSRELIVPDAGATWPHTVELFTLTSAPRIRLIFVNIPDGGAQIGKCDYAPYDNALINMYDNPQYVTDTIVPDCGPAEGYDKSPKSCPDTDAPQGYPNPFICNANQGCSPSVPWQNYDQAGVMAVLKGIIDKYQPIVIRTLDPQPFALENQVAYDNPDHIAAARFVDRVLAGYHGPNGTARYRVVYYQGYGFTSYPRNLGLADHDRKRTTALTYAAHDPNYQANLNGYEGWYYLMYERYPGTTTWMERSRNGRLVAFSVQDRQIEMWAETGAGTGTWTGPTPVGGAGAPVSPQVTVVRRPDGLLQLFALRLPLERDTWALSAGPPFQEIITAVQIADDPIAFGSWQSLAAPDTGQFVSAPTAAFDGSGQLFAFARNSSTTISYTFMSGDTWSPWSILNVGGQNIMEGISPITRNDGVIEVYATARSGEIFYYTQSGTEFTNGRTLPFLAASPPTAAKMQDGRVAVFYREPQDYVTIDPAKYGRVMMLLRDGNVQWEPPTPLYGDAGTGPVAALQRAGTGQIMLFERNSWGGISETQQSAPNSSFNTQWQVLSASDPTQPRFEEYPAAAMDGAGRVVVLAKGSDGKMYARRESSAAAVGSFDGWTQAGN